MSTWRPVRPAFAACGIGTVLRRSLPALCILASAACSDSPADPLHGTVLEIAAGNAQLAPCGSAVAIEPTVEVTDGSGRPRRNMAVMFEVVGGGGWTRTGSTFTDAAGRASAWWLLGPDPDVPQRLRASAAAGTVEFTATAIASPAATVLTGRNAYIEYTVGNLPLILSAPHGGYLQPAEIPDRTYGTTGRDVYTQELIRTLRQAVIDRTGGMPHVIINRLHRVKLDANREIVEAAQGSAAAERAWFEWHAFIEAAKAAAAAEGPDGAALYLDVHGQSSHLPRIEIGYLLSAADLALPAAALGQGPLIAKSSIRALARNDGPRFVELVRGATSLGEMLERSGYPAVPSATRPDPGNNAYYSAGYNTERHGSRDGGTVSGMQLELNLALRDTETARAAFTDTLSAVIARYFEVHMGTALLPSCPAPAPRPGRAPVRAVVHR